MIKDRVIGRADDIIKVKGVLLVPTAIEDAVSCIRELGREYNVTVEGNNARGLPYLHPAATH